MVRWGNEIGGQKVFQYIRPTDCARVIDKPTFDMLGSWLAKLSDWNSCQYPVGLYVLWGEWIVVGIDHYARSG